MEDYSKQVLRIVVAQVCQAIGWHAIQSTPLELLTDILHKYMQELSVRTFRYTQLYARTEANLDDVGLAFRDVGINVPDLLDYINNVDSVPCAIDVPRYPLKKESSLNFLKPGSKEVITRPVHVHEHLPPIHPEKEDDCPSPQEQSANVPNPVHTSADPSSVITDITNATANTVNIINNNKGFKKPEPCESTPTHKKSRVLHEDEGRPTREISSVMMTSSGFISPAREGKLPDSKTPIIPEYKPIRPPTPPQPIKNAPITTPLPVPAASPLGNLAEVKSEKKSKKQKASAVSPVSVETKEQRKRERHLAKLQKRRADTLEIGKSPSKKPKIRESKAKHHPIQSYNASPVIGPAPVLPAPLDPPFPPVSLPADLTIKSETVVVTPASSANLPSSALNLDSATVTTTLLSNVDIKPSPSISDEVKLSSEPDKQKYSIFKKISAKKSREENQKGSYANNNLSSNDLFSAFPTLPESTTIRRLPPIKFDSPPHTDPNVIVVDDDTPPRPSSPLELSGTQILSIPSLPAGTTATTSPALKTPFFDNPLMNMRQTNTIMEPVRKQQRKPRKNKQQVLVEQSAPLNLSNESSTTKDVPLAGNTPTPGPSKAPRKRLNKVGRPSKRTNNKLAGIPANTTFPPAMGLPPMNPESLKRDLSSLSVFKGGNNQFLPNMSRYPYLNPFHLLGGPGLIPNPTFMHPSSNPLLGFPNPFSYNEFMGLRPPIRPPKIEETKPASPPPSIPLDLESNVYCNVPPLVPDSMKLHLSPALSSRGNKPLSISAITPPASGDSFTPLKCVSSKIESQSLSVYHNTTPPAALSRSPKMVEATIEISDDEKSMTKSDTEIEKPTDSPKTPTSRSSNNNTVTSTSENVSSPNKNSNPRLGESKSTTEVSDEFDNVIETDNDQADTSLMEKSCSTSDDLAVPGSAGNANIKGDKKRDKEHKKGKRGREGKIKKKKDKKDKTKNKEKADKRKEEKKEKDRSKKKKEKRKDKLKTQPYTDATNTDKPTSNESIGQHEAAIPSTLPASMVPKLTLKFGSPQSVASDDSPETRKIAKSFNGGEESIDNGTVTERRESSPELARISPLVTRPPKQKTSTKEKNSDGEQATTVSAPSAPSNLSTTTAAPSNKGPGRPSKTQSATTVANLAQGQSSPAPSSSTGAATIAAVTTGADTNSSATVDNKSSAEPPANDRGPPVTSTGTASGNSIGLRSSAKVTGALNVAGSTAKQATAEPIDAEGNQVWICPACGKVDDGTPMIGCDGCDAWYHWVCVGIQVPPDECEDWYCRNCIIKKQEANYYDKKKKRKKKNKAN